MKYKIGKNPNSWFKNGHKYFKNDYKGEKAHQWKGDNVGYCGIHLWIRKTYGEPTTCEHCQTGNLTGHYIHWASKSKNYTRNRENWMRLCAKCHRLYDKVNNLRKFPIRSKKGQYTNEISN